MLTIQTQPPKSQKAGDRPISFVLAEYSKSDIQEYKFVIRPEELSRMDPSRVTVHQTLGGERLGWADDFGQGLPTINISGHTGWRVKHDYRPSGVRVDVMAMTERTVTLSMSVEMLPGYALTQAVIQSIRNVFDAAVVAVPPGETLYLNDVSELVLTVTGIKHVTINASENIVCGENEALSPGNLTVNLIT